MDKPRIGYVGLGVMGGALARRLLREHKLTVFDLSPERCADFAAMGATAFQKGLGAIHGDKINRAQ